MWICFLKWREGFLVMKKALILPLIMFYDGGPINSRLTGGPLEFSILRNRRHTILLFGFISCSPTTARVFNVLSSGSEHYLTSAPSAGNKPFPGNAEFLSQY